ncbi:MARVEL domain-containing protein 3 isoform X3 [Arapaima gigas]
MSVCGASGAECARQRGGAAPPGAQVRSHTQNRAARADLRVRSFSTMPEGNGYYDRDPDYYGRQKDYSSRPKAKSGSSHRSPPAYRDPLPPAQQEDYETSVSPTAVDPYEQRERRQAPYNLKYLCTGRAICQMLEVTVNMLIVICAGVTYSSSGTYRDLASLGGLYAYYYGGASAFTGTDAVRIKELDTQFYQLKLPPYIFTMACGGALMGYACAVLLLGILRVPFRWPPLLLLEAVLNALIALGYIPAVAFYFIKLQASYDTTVCKERQQMYESKGHQGYECKLNAADICGGLLGVAGAIIFAGGAVLAIRAFREVRERKKKSHHDPPFSL